MKEGGGVRKDSESCSSSSPLVLPRSSFSSPPSSCPPSSCPPPPGPALHFSNSQCRSRDQSYAICFLLGRSNTQAAIIHQRRGKEWGIKYINSKSREKNYCCCCCCSWLGKNLGRTLYDKAIVLDNNLFHVSPLLLRPPPPPPSLKMDF